MTNIPYGMAGAVLLPFVLYPLSGVSQTERQSGVHDHGHSEMNIALTGNEFLVELLSPAANVLGFEHEPETEEQRAALAEAVSALRAGEQVLQLSAAAGCTLQTADIESKLTDEEHSEEHHDDEHADEHDKDEHSKEHHDDEHAKDEHSEEHHDDEHADEHSEFHVTWFYRCDKPAELKTVDVALFDLFPGFEEIDVSFAGENYQLAWELSPGNSRLTLQ